MSIIQADNVATRDGSESTDMTNVVNGCAKAWVNFDGTTNTINSSFNVSSITDNGTGQFTVNLTNNAPDGNYVVSSSGNAQDGSSNNRSILLDPNIPPTISGFSIFIESSNGSQADIPLVCAAAFWS